jgi:hypothetical protein
MLQAFIDCWSEEVDDETTVWFADAVDVEDEQLIHAGSVSEVKKEAIRQCEEQARNKGVQIVQEF